MVGFFCFLTKSDSDGQFVRVYPGVNFILKGQSGNSAESPTLDAYPNDAATKVRSRMLARPNSGTMTAAVDSEDDVT